MTSGGRATLYSSAGCRVAYVTDHSDGIATKTWAQYSSDVNAATITGVISLYPGAEVEVGTFTSRTEENDWAVGRSPARPPR